MDHWGIIAWIGERTRPRLERLAVLGEASKTAREARTVPGGWRELTVQIGHDA